MNRILLSVEEAVERLLALAKPVADRESVTIADAPGRVPCETVLALCDQPPFDRSPLDGFALHHADTANASGEHPARLAVTADVFAGDAGPERLERGRAVRILTGAPIPPGATCVVRQEDVATDDGAALVPYSLGEYQNYCFRGEYLKKGAALLRAGEPMDRGAAALLAGDGRERVAVFRRPRVAILSTGNELVAAGDALARGKIYDNNRPMLIARAAELGAEVTDSRTERDDPERIAAALREMFALADLVLVTGGVSVGERDYLPAAAELAGAERVFHGVRVKPGSPALAVVRDGKLALCLSGNPFAAFVTCELFAAPVIRLLAGWRSAKAQRVACRLGEGIAERNETRRFAPGKMLGGEVLFPGGKAGSRSLAALVGANCLVDIPPGKGGLGAGAEVEAIPL